ncbi:MAG: ATP-binding protein [Planctomycetota bacterium]|nr:ATP-binding protein [Planctomycetota bacterium]
MTPPSGGQHLRAALDVPHDPGAIGKAEERVLDALAAFSFPKASVFAVRLCLHEAISNAFRHGHRNLPPHTPISLRYDVSAERVEILVEDQGPGFDPGAVPDPTADENLERGSGRGLLLIRAYMASAEYNAKGNALRMVYQRPADVGGISNSPSI